MIKKLVTKVQAFKASIKQSIGRLFGIFSNLNPREQQIVLIGIPLTVLIIFGIIFSVIASNTNKLERAHKRLLKDLKYVQTMKLQYKQAKSQKDQVRSRLNQQSGSFSILTFLEEQANQQKLADSIGSIAEKPGAKTDAYTETSVQVKMQKISLAQLINYLFNLEHSSHLIRIKSLRVKPRYDDTQYLDVDFQVSSFEVKA